MMQYDDLAVIILAAGKGTRMKSDLAKVLHEVDGKSMVLHVLSAASQLTPNHIHVVVGHQADQVRRKINSHFKPQYAVQHQLLGTGDAVKAAIPGISPEVKHVIVLCGDVPLIQSSTLLNLVKRHSQQKAQVTVLATVVDDPSGYGRLITDSKEQLLSIREEADASDSEKQIRVINTGIYCFERQFLESAISRITPDNNQAEYYLTDLIEIAQKNDKKIAVNTMDDPDQVMGVNTLGELEKANRLIDKYAK